jgi:transposase
MNDATFFTRPTLDWQRRYEALRALFVERQPAKVVAEKFRYTYGYIRLLKHQFVHGKIDFSEPVTEGQVARRGINAEVRAKIRQWRERRLTAGEIAELLSEEGTDLSVRTVQRVLAEEGFPRVPRRTKLKLGLTVKGAEVPPVAEQADLNVLEGRRFDCAGAGVFLFAPFLAQLDIARIVREAKLPGSKVISATSYLLSFIALKLLGNERYAHVGEHAFDAGLALFAGLTSLPKCTALSTYSYGLDQDHIRRLQKAFVQQAIRLGLYEGKVVNLDFHTVPHYGEESVLEKHWAGARGKTMKSALTLFAQDADSKLMLYTDADIRRDEADDQALQFLDFWKQVRRGVQPLLVFDSRFTSYSKLSELNAQGVRFITLRRRGERLLADVDRLSPWIRIHIPHAKRKYPNPQVHESRVKLKGYNGELRQLIVRGNGHEKPAFLITNDFDTPPELLVGDYARRWRIENGLAEAVDFFHLNALSSPILTKVHFDVALTLVADTLYTMLARKLRGFEDCDAAKLFRHFVRGKASVTVGRGKLTVTFPRRAHNPILRRVPWDQLPSEIPGLPDTDLVLNFR